MKLNVAQYGSAIDDSQPPIIILHGLFGSHRNWQPIARKLSKNNLVYALDCRNHGLSPHSEIMNYQAMAQDVLEFIENTLAIKTHESHPEHVNIIAHSMGGKAALFLALNRPELINKLIIVDIAPVRYQHEFDDVLNAFYAVPLAQIKSRQEADEYLSHSIKQQELRLFLLQNLQFKEGQYRWRLNLEAIARAIPVIIDFPDMTGLAPYSKRVLFVGGGQSDYLNQHNKNLTRELFPLASFSMIKSAGHWLHAEQPELFLSLIEPYLES